MDPGARTLLRMFLSANRFPLRRNMRPTPGRDDDRETVQYREPYATGLPPKNPVALPRSARDPGPTIRRALEAAD